MKASDLMKFDVKVGEKNLDFLSVVVFLALKHPCVATAVAVAVIRSHDRGVPSSLGMNHYAAII